MDTLTKILGGLMIVVIFIVIIIVRPPVGMAIKETFLPEAKISDMVPAILTLLGGTVGGYITFAGAHRLIDANITKQENLGEITKSSVMGIVIATIVRASRTPTGVLHAGKNVVFVWNPSPKSFLK